jgi:cytosine/adenosine deaminase-related metal-dependent hydrolase
MLLRFSSPKKEKHMKRSPALSAALILAALLITAGAPAQLPAQGGLVPVPARADGDGPFDRLVLHGGIVIDGTGAVPAGPMQIVIEKNRITQVRSVGTPGMPVPPPPQARAGEKVVDVTGMYVMPGFIDMHEHVASSAVKPGDYFYKLLMAHGVTSVRDVGSGGDLNWAIDQKTRSAQNAITAPRIFEFSTVNAATPEAAREYVRTVKAKGGDGIKMFGLTPKVYAAVLDEAKKQGLRTSCHLSQNAAGRTTILDLARMGLTTMEHWYGLPESFLDKSTIQDWPVDAVYGNEQDRFGQAGRLWKQAAPPYSEKWHKVMDELLKLNFTICPTLTIYEASRDLMRARCAEWNETYVLPRLWAFFEPSRLSHGAYWYYWTTADEVEWKRNYQLWMTFINEYKNRGGRIVLGADSGFIYNLFGFGFVREFELLQEAGFHPLEVMRAATLEAARTLGVEDELGTVEPGKLADLAVVAANPLENFKVLYGTGAIRVNAKNEVTRAGGIAYTIKDGILYDAKKLLEDVRKMVADAKTKEKFEFAQPGMKKAGIK